MASELRASEPSDAPALAALAQRLLGVAPSSPMFEARHMRWKYWSAAGDDGAPRGYVLVRDGVIVAHAAALPLHYPAAGRALRLLHPFDWMSEPSAIGSGAALLSRLSKLADGLLIVGGSEATQRMVRPLGFRPLGAVGLYAAARAPASDRQLTAAPLAPEALSGPHPSLPPWLAAEPRAAWLRACLSCPAAPMTLHSVERASRPLGAVLLAFTPGQARVAAHWPASSDPSERAALLLAARQLASEREGVGEVVCMANAPHDVQALQSAGFRAVGSVPMFVLARGAALADDARLAFQMLDGDLAFLHHGQPERWSAGSL